MNRPVVRRIPGFQDLAGPEEASKAAAESALFGYLALAGYEAIETPLLEEADLFLRKSGGELASRIYAFTDPGGRRVALRPEFTASIIRAFIQGRRPVPVRWRYAGPVFRYAPADHDPLHQRTQVGAEFVGRADPLADAEVLALACGGLRQVGLTAFTPVLGHLGVIQGLLQGFSLSGRAELFLIQQIGALQDPQRGAAWVREQAQELGLARNAFGGGADLSSLNLAEARVVLHHLLTSLGTAPLGGRDLGQVEERFLEKLRAADRPEKLEEALRFVSALCALRGEPAEVLARATETVASFGLDPDPLNGVKGILALLEGEVLGGAPLVLDLGLVRGLAYYTGMVFEVRHPQERESLCGGGRYDGLVLALGGEDVPALGFAYGVEAVVGALQAEGKRPHPARAAQGRGAAPATAGLPPARSLREAVARWDAGRKAKLSGPLLQASAPPFA